MTISADGTVNAALIPLGPTPVVGVRRSPGGAWSPVAIPPNAVGPAGAYCPTAVNRRGDLLDRVPAELVASSVTCDFFSLAASGPAILVIAILRETLPAARPWVIADRFVPFYPQAGPATGGPRGGEDER